MAAIRRLAPDVASRIAAGEVIERPASVLKELIENALDAGAMRIQVETLAAGKKLLRVSDDGAGMDPADCRLAFERHTTSKIEGLEDLESLSTFGFRGEALFSIAAVSRASVASCPKGSKKGWVVEIEGGKVRAEHEAPPVAGTTVEVKDLFYNTPARAKFLKSDASEKGHLARIVEEAALANPEVAFAYRSDGRAVLRLAVSPGRDPALRLRGRIREVLGSDLGEGLLQVDERGPEVSVRAFLAPAEAVAATRANQFWFLNRRPIASRLLQQALYRAYSPFLSRDRHPVCVALLEMPPERFDVNVHPAKREVRFRSERAIFEAVSGAFSGTLLRAKGIPTVTPGSSRGVIAPDRLREAIAAYKTGPIVRFGEGAESGPRLDERAAPFLSFEASSASAAVPAAGAPRWFTPPLRYLGQIERSYLVFDAAGGMLVVDQHAAQERILFERYAAEMESGRLKPQPLMLPVGVELPASQVTRVLAQSARLERAGFEVEAFGKTTLNVTAAPALFQKASDLKELVHRLLEGLDSPGSAAAQIRHDALATVACKAAVKAHDALGAAEALRLLEDLKDCKDGTCCPHGRPSMISLSRDELARRFKRPGAVPL